MKKSLLTLSLGLASLAMTAQTYEVTQDWMHKSGDAGFTFAAAGDARWAAAHQGTIYVADKAKKVVNAYTKDGQTTLETGTAGWCLSSDEAGNLILQNALWGTGSVTYKILPAGKTTAADLIDLKVTPPEGCAAASMHTIGRTIGNVLSPEGGVFYTYGNAQTSISKIFVANGKQDAAKSAAIAVAKTHTGHNQAFVQPTNSDLNATDNFIYRIRTIVNHFCKPDGNSFKDVGTNSSIGGDIVTLGGVQYTVEPSGTNYSDGFIIVNRETNKVVYTHAETFTVSGQQATPLIFEKVDETTANLYQYVLGQYVAKYTFKVLPPAQDQVAYIIGEVDNQGWNPTQGIALYGSDNKYEGYAYFKANANFGISTVLAQNNDQGGWDYVNGNRYGHPDGNEAQLPGIGQAQKVTKNQNAIKCPVEGYYKVTVDLTAGSESITLDYVDKLRIIGSISSVNYNPLADWDMTTKSLVFAKDAEGYCFSTNGLYLRNNDQFIITPVVENYNSWDRVNHFRIGAADAANNKITETMANAIAIAAANGDGDGTKNIFVDCEIPGAFDMTIDLANMTIITNKYSGVEENIAEKGEAQVIANGGMIQVIGGNLTSIYSLSGQLIVANSTEKYFNVANGLYIVTVDGKAHKIIVR